MASGFVGRRKDTSTLGSAEACPSSSGGALQNPQRAAPMMLTTVDTVVLVNQKSRELLDSSTMAAWAACVSIWSRVFVLSSPEWARSPELSQIMSAALSAAMQRSAAQASVTFSLPDSYCRSRTEFTPQLQEESSRERSNCQDLWIDHS
jgi:hypothetical protein